MFEHLLIANRGEIACRIIRTARRMGIRTIAVYSDADTRARHVRLADEAVRIGPPPPRESYLAIGNLVAAAQRSGAQAIHPGYGFLSENADFAAACLDAGLVFVGPGPDAIRTMGSKAAAKTLMARAGLPILPGYHGGCQEADFLAAEAAAIGYPVLIKAIAGGGGRGLRRVDRPEDFSAALAACRREAAASFGDDRVLLEKYLMNPRHVEVQIFADSHGHCLHLFERDCSVQRRHQKVVEEAPAPDLDADLRRRLGAAAVTAAQAVDYVGAGTVEFMVDREGAFYFLEMNTRLQVEHPVTEMISGQDLVEWQLRVAAGETLPLPQAALQIHGHAMEVRIYAEDADRGFLPSCGRLVSFSLPAEGPHLRIDAGLEAGDDITPYYDPLIAKLIAWGEDRETALSRLRRALTRFRVAGVSTNIGFLSRLLGTSAFSSGQVHTGLIEAEEASLFPPPSPLPREALLAAAVGELLAEDEAARLQAEASADPWSPWHGRDGWRLNLRAERRLLFRHGEAAREVQVVYLGQEEWQLGVEGNFTRTRGHRLDGEDFAVEFDGRRFPASRVAWGEKRQIFLGSDTYALLLEAPLAAPEAVESQNSGLNAPMPGKIAAHLAKPGERVEKGASLLILEAMKMEHTLTAPAAGLVQAYHYEVGQQVAEGAPLIAFEPDK